MAWLPDGEKISKISLFVLAQLTNVTDRQTDGQTQMDGHRVTAIAAICIASHGKNMSVRQSVHYVLVSEGNGLTYRHSFFPPYGSPIILVLPASNTFTKFRRGRVYKFRDFRSISRYISQTIQNSAIVTMEGE